MTKKLLAALAFCLVAGAQAAPTQYAFQYTALGGGVLSGSLMGDLQGDNNTIVVTSILDFVQINGLNGPSLPFIDALTHYLGGPSADPIVSLDGSAMDLIACTASFCNVGFLIETSPTYFGSGSTFSSSADVGGFSEQYFPARWQIQSVPEPGTLALLGLGLAGLAATRRRKQ